MTKKKPSGKPSAQLVPQDHGGALLPGAGGGPQPGSGRHPSKLRGSLRAILERGGLEVLEGYMQGRVPVKMVGKCEKCGHEHEDYKLLPEELELLSYVKDTDRLKAIEILARYGGVDKLALTVDEQPETEVTPERVAELWERWERIKTVKELEKLMIGAAKKQLRGGE